MIAVARRVLGVLPVLVAVVLLCWPAIGIWRLELVDYGAKYTELVEYTNKMAAKRAREKNEPLVVRESTPQGLDQYVAKKTRLSRRKVDGPAWEGLFQKASQAGKSAYFPADTQPLAALIQANDRDFFNLELPGKYPVFLNATLDPINASFHGPQVTWGMGHPLSWLTPWLAGLGLFVYVFLPRPKKKPGWFRYHKVRSQIGVDILGLILAGLFLVLPLFIIPELAGRPQPLSPEKGKAVFTLVFWFVALVTASLFVISAWYEGLGFQLTRTGIRKFSLLKSEEFSFDQMEEMEKTMWRPPAWYRRLSWLMIGFSLGAAAPMILGSMNTAPFVKVHTREGRTLSIMTKYLLGWEELEKALMEAKVEYREEEAQ